MKYLKDLLKTLMYDYWLACVVVGFVLTAAAFNGLRSYEPVNAAPVAVLTEPAAQVTAPSPVVELSRVLELLEKRRTPFGPVPRPGAIPPPPVKTALQPIPDPLIMALHKQNEAMSDLLARFVELENRFNTVLQQSATPPAGKQSNAAALDDIHTYVEPPELPDPLVKAMAKYPGARIIADPDTGEYVPAVVEIRETNWGGGKQLHLLRSRGKVYGQTVIHRSREKKEEPAPPQPPPFRISN